MRTTNVSSIYYHKAAAGTVDARTRRVDLANKQKNSYVKEIISSSDRLMSKIGP